MSRSPCSHGFVVGVLAILLSLTAGCGDDDAEVTSGTTSEPSVTTALSSTGSPSSTTETTEQTATGQSVTEQTVTEQTVSSEAEGDRLIGRILDTQWIEGNTTQIYLIDDAPIGLTSGTRLPLALEGDEVSLELGFADWSGIGGARGRYGEDWEGELLLLEVADRRGPWERYLVRDHESLTIPAGRGFAAAMCFENGVPHAVEVQFSDRGPLIARAWEADLDRLSLEAVPPDTLSCPDLQARPVGPGSVGAIFTPSGYGPSLDDDCGDTIEISGATPTELPYLSLGGCMIGSGVIGDDVALSVVGDLGLDSGEGWVRLEGFLGWDYSGSPLWRILDAQAIRNLDSISLECWTADGAPAVATVEGPIDDPTPTEAWSTDRDRLALISVDPATVTCEYFGD